MCAPREKRQAEGGKENMRMDGKKKKKKKTHMLPLRFAEKAAKALLRGGGGGMRCNQEKEPIIREGSTRKGSSKVWNLTRTREV